MASLSIRIEGAKRVKDYLQNVQTRIRTINHKPFAQALKTEARKNLEDTRKGWPNPRNKQHLDFTALTRRLKSGTTVLLTASARGKDGFNYAETQEAGGKARKAPRGKLMRFMTPSGGWVAVKRVGPIPAKHYMEKTALWAADAYPAYIEQKVGEALERG